MRIKEHLNKDENKKIKFVWYDAWCMLQDVPGQEKRKGKEEYEFKNMLKNVNLLYLSANVLIIMDRMFSSRL